MSVRSAQSITKVFTTRRFDTGAATNADSTPTGTLYVNGTADAATVTVTNITTGVYKAAVTLPTLAAGDVVDLRINATVNSVADNGIVWSDTKDLALDSSYRPGIDWSNVGAPTTTLALTGTTVGTVTTVTNRVTANVDQIDGAAWATHSAGYAPADVRQFGGTNATSSGGRPEVNATHFAGTISAGAAGYVGLDWGHITASATTVALTGTTVADTQKVDVVTIKTQSVTCSGGVTVPAATLASTTNITAGTVTTVTNLTNAPTAGDFTATMKTSIGTAVAASAVASVTGGVGGSIGGDVQGGVLGGVGGSIGGDLAGNVLGSVAGGVGGDVSGKVLGGGSGIIIGTGCRSDLRAWNGTAPSNLISGRVDANTQATAAALTFGLTGSVTGSLSGSVGSVTGNVGGNLLGDVNGSVVGDVGGNLFGNVLGNVNGSVGTVASGGITAASFTAGAINASAIAADAITSSELATSAAQKIADVTLRRQMASVEASAFGDSLDKSSLYGSVQAQQQSSVSGTTWTIRRTDGVTTLGTKTITKDATADPVTGVS